MHILGLPLWRKRLSDAEYIEQVRKSLHYSRRLRFFYSALGLAITGIAIWGIIIFTQIFASFITAPGQQGVIYGAFVVATFFGLMIGGLLSKAGESLAAALFRQDRKDRLLIECWDALREDSMGNGDSR